MTPESAAAIAAKTKPISGWFMPEAVRLFAWIDDIQKSLGVTGHLFEIGVHHGKSAVMLASMADEGESLRVCDLFGEQGRNVSRSGGGDRAVFEANFARLASAGTDLTVYAQRSSDLSRDTIGGGYRFFHIDGGHHADEAVGDLQLAAAVTQPPGVLVLDDPFRPEWPGVTEAALDFLRTRGDYRAVLVGFNKLIFTHADHAADYQAAFDDERQRAAYGLGFPWSYKQQPFAGEQLRVMYMKTSHSRTPKWYLRMKDQVRRKVRRRGRAG